MSNNILYFVENAILPKKEHEKELRRNIYFRENNGIVQQEKRQPDNESDMPYLPNKLPN